MVTASQIIRSAAVHWEGDIARGRGTITSESGNVQAAYSFGTRFSGDPGTNPEELLAAAHAACFTMALSAELTRGGHAPKALDSKAFVRLDKIEGGFKISSIELTVTAIVEGLSDEEFQRSATQAKETCPLSRALQAIPMTLKATLG